MKENVYLERKPEFLVDPLDRKLYRQSLWGVVRA
jgi:hypothetical protein